MKKIILILIFMIKISFISYSQIEYPIITIDTLGQKVVTMTLKQARNLEKNTELLKMFKNLSMKYGTYDTLCIGVIREKDSIISSKELQIMTLNDIISHKNSQISNYKEAIVFNKENEIDYVKIIKEKDVIISTKDKQIKKAIWKSGISGILIGVIITLIL